MCGIAAIHSHHGSPDTECADAAAQGMLDRLAHRGPDDSGSRIVGGHTWLGHRRLSIVDLDGGHQPLGGTAGDDDWSLVCNGEIYNHETLREELPDASFGSSSSDSAAALAVLRTEGPDGLHRLRGMWALCAATPGGRFVAARDAIGVKPLYWARTDTAVHFASELRAFHPDVQPSAEIFPPGCWWTPEDGLRRFAQPVPEAAGDGWGGVSEQVVEKATFEAVADSVRRHLMADVEVGVFLSGGLDSSLVAAVAADTYARQGRRLKTFAVGTEDSPDLLAAREAAAFLGTEHHEAVLDAEAAARALDEVVGCVESFDASLIRSAVPNWFLSELAARHVKAVLTGEGADELFAGYGYYHERYAQPGELDAELRRTIGQLHGLNLQRCDRVTMAHGLEARVPFLDRDVIAHAMSLPASVKGLEADGMEKGHLRRAFAGWLPEHLLWRRKEQFGTGSGAESVLSPLWETRITDAEFAAAVAEDGAPELRSKEELGYYRTFRAALPGVRPEAVLTRFATA
ncbi:MULTISPECIES: asparagine synthase (glutamine-hydrolyzing) [unclassified Streptomyces]|uniref:asparagine synthase (glutamine-hydrolyzing) n=1 Tax=unclassified Streptomyces TaxID=2593676 RepID=UPI00278BB0D4|nr:MULTISPECIES: asparagine synthase (glutamine-hydrolyzing) [unclassified Streptomyces]